MPVCGLHAARVQGQTPERGSPRPEDWLAGERCACKTLSSKHRAAANGDAEVPTARERTRASAGALLRPHDLLLLVCDGEADTAEQGVQVAPAVRGQAAVQTGRFVQLTLLLPAGVQELLLRGAEPLQGLPVGRTWGRAG